MFDLTAGTARVRGKITADFGLIILLALWGCGCQRSLAPADLVILNGPEPESLDPAILTGQADMRAAMPLFEGLTRFDPKTAKPVPGLAARWDVADDLTRYTFYLRTNLWWSTGEAITAADVVYSWRRLLDPATASDYAGQLFCVRGAEAYATGKGGFKDVAMRARDPLTLEVDLRGPTPFFLDLCASATLRIVPRQAIEKYQNRWLLAQPVPSSGAYELVFWRINDRIRYRKNPRYWDAANTQIDVIDLLPCTVAPTALNLYETGAADVIWDKELIPMDVIDELRRRPDFHVYNYLGSYFLRFNVTKRPFQDARVRRALALVVDRQRIVEKITKAGERPSAQYVPPGVAGYESPPGLEYDPDQARQLLSEAGYPGGAGFPRFEYMFNNVRAHEKIAVELQAMWQKELGIQVELRQLEWKVYLRAQSRLEYDVCRSSWIGDYNDANTFLDIFMSNNGNNRTGWSHARYDELLREGNRQTDLARRARMLQEAETILIRDELPIVPLYIYVGMECFDPERVEGIYGNILAEHPLHAIRLKGARRTEGGSRARAR